MKKILFSAVGDRDPVSNLHDGPLLHILRHYKPDKVYLYMTQKILKHHQLDNRYMECIHWLEEDLNHSFDVEIIEASDVIEPHKFDKFYPRFSAELDRISEKLNDNDEVLLNLSSGTPAIKTALSVLAILNGEKFKQIQVSAPEEEYNNPLYNQYREYHGKESYEDNFDREEQSSNRCHEPKGNYLVFQIQKRIFFSHLDAFEYMAARDVLRGMLINSSDQELYHLLNAAVSRTLLDMNSTETCLKNANAGHLIATRQQLRKLDQKITYEGILLLQLKENKRLYGDFLRFITPVFFNLLLIYLQENHNIKKHQISYEDNGSRWKLPAPSDAKMKSIEKFINNNDLKDKYLDSRSLLLLLEHIDDPNPIINKFQEIRKVELRIRNRVAHDLLSVTEEWIKTNVEKSSTEILNLIKDVFTEVLNIKDRSIWASYIQLNKYIKERLELFEDSYFR